MRNLALIPGKTEVVHSILDYYLDLKKVKEIYYNLELQVFKYLLNFR